MNEDAVLTILGCGDSAGVPRIGGDWGACDPMEPKNRRTRPSVAVQTKTTSIVVDTGVDFSAQLSRESISDLSAILYTHGHADHVNGMDDLRFVYLRHKKHLPVYADAQTFTEISHRFDYLFKQKSPYYPPVADHHLLIDENLGSPHHVGDISFIPFLQNHGQGTRSLGYRFGDIGYSTDMANLDDTAIETLRGIKVWVADCSDYHRPDFIFHSNIPNLQRLNEMIGAELVLLTHLRHQHDYQTLVRECPKGFSPAYDSMKIRLDGTVL